MKAAKADEEALKELESFLNILPHKYFDEMQLHAFIISEIKDFDECMEEVERFLPYVDNWATCDQLSPKVFGKKKDGRLVYGTELLEHIDRWLDSDETYTVRYGIGRLMAHFLDEEFDPLWMDRIASVRSDEYYINMMIAWYFATALAKQPDAAMAVLHEGRLDKWTHNKAIQKATESRRITDEMKAYLRSIRQ
jgi:3-methyladenine DNA glycosylase AlkD